MSAVRRKLDDMEPAELLAFERANPRHTTRKWLRIRDQLGLTETRYYVLLTRAASSEAGMTADPVTARLVRDRAARRRMEREKRTAVWLGPRSLKTGEGYTVGYWPTN